MCAHVRVCLQFGEAAREKWRRGTEAESMSVSVIKQLLLSSYASHLRL